MSEYLVPFLIMTVLIALNGVFVAAEFAIVGSSKTRLASLAEQGSAGARALLSIRRDPDKMNRYIATAQVGITLASLGLGMYGEPVVARWLGGSPRAHEGDGHGVGLTVAAILLLTYPHVVLGEMVPKSVALESPVRAALALRHVMSLVERLTLPLVVSLNAIGNGLMRLCRIPPVDESRHLYSPEELELVVRESHEGGLVGTTEELMVENIFDLSERTAGQVMTPRTRVEGLRVELSLKEALARVCETGFSRHPVYRESLDHVAGLLYTKDLARHYAHHGTAGTIPELMRPARFVSEATPVEKLLQIFRQEHLQMAVVLDEFGGTAGVVTLEDVVEEVVGEIQDEFDEEQPLVRELGPRVYEVRGELLLQELEQNLDRPLSHPEVDTVGGLFLASLHDVPENGALIEWAGIRWTALEVSGSAVLRVQVDLQG
ncbi:MAG: HlyC/CorC family transporter [Armatimonadetes bacterium]|nr:HlyC/CorC family transporter [Armatimonadota bacterium]